MQSLTYVAKEILESDLIYQVTTMVDIQVVLENLNREYVACKEPHRLYIDCT